MKFLLDDGNQHVSRHGAPNLRLDGILPVAQELLDSQVLLDPFEEQFDLPTVLVECGDGQRGQDKVVGQEYIIYSTLRHIWETQRLILKLTKNGKKRWFWNC